LNSSRNSSDGGPAFFVDGWGEIMGEAVPQSRKDTLNLGSLEKVPRGQGFCFVVAGREIAVFRQRDGRLFATQNRCPHRQGPLSEGLIGSGKVICPLHGHKFDLETGRSGDPGEALLTYRVWEEKGEILVGVEGTAAKKD
jgi:nitrite reductase (NADH) small subunit